MNQNQNTNNYMKDITIPFKYNHEIEMNQYKYPQMHTNNPFTVPEINNNPFKYTNQFEHNKFTLPTNEFIISNKLQNKGKIFGIALLATATYNLTMNAIVKPIIFFSIF